LGVPIWLSFLIPIVVAFIIGYLNGWIVTYFNVLSFVTTLGLGTVLGGLIFWVTDGATIFENIHAGFRYLDQNVIVGIPLLSFIMLFLTLCFWYIMTHTAFGRRLYAIGGNEQAARTAGVNVVSNKRMAFALCATLAAITGMLMASRLGSAQPTGGDG